MIINQNEQQEFILQQIQEPRHKDSLESGRLYDWLKDTGPQEFLAYGFIASNKTVWRKDNLP
jgi:hypothetical protein